jgi:hypothetical protein
MSARPCRHAVALAILLLAAGVATAAPGPEQAGENDQPTQPAPTEASSPPVEPKTPAETAKPPAEEAKPPAAEAKPAASPAPRNIQPIDRSEALSILGKKVTGPGGENMGRIVDVLVDGESRPRAAVIDFGGFLGVGNRKIAVDWQLLQFHPDNAATPVLLSASRAEVQAAPEYKPSNQPAEVVAPPPAPASGSSTDAGR